MEIKKKYTYRLATNEDTANIVELLKICLGESDNRTVEYWNWKHNNNPFGSSFVLLAFDDGKLIGVRTFMKWEWVKDAQVYKCVRTVDAVVHPDYRKRGLFSKLTMYGLDLMKENKIDFIFNTPNSNSMPGNLKMGWKVLGKTGLKVKVNNPINSIYYRAFNREFDITHIAKEHNVGNLSKAYLSEFLLNSVQDNAVLRKNLSSEYLIWRYQEVPVFKYGVFKDPNDEFLIFFRQKEKGPVRELRVCDIILKNLDTSKVGRALKQLMKQYNADIATLTGEDDSVFNALRINAGFLNLGFKGLNVVLREVNISVEPYLHKEAWGWTSGDIELF